MGVHANSRSADPAQHLAPLHLQAPPPQRWVARSTRFAKEMSIKRSTMPRRRHGSGLTLGFIRAATRRRSEEHTSELQSLMRISYAVFCLKKKKKRTPSTSLHNQTCTEATVVAHKQYRHTKRY